MRPFFRRYLVPLLVPGALLLGGGFWLWRRFGGDPPAAPLLQFFPLVVLVLGFFLGWRFDRTRLVFVLVLLALADRALALVPDGVYGQTVALAAALAIPLNLVWIALMRERGLLTPRGLSRLGLLLSQAVIVDLLARSAPEETVAALTASLGAVALPSLALPPPVPVATAVALVVLLGRFLHRPSVLEGAFPWVLGAAVLGLQAGEDGTTFFFAVAGLILTAAVLEQSHGMAFRDDLTGLPGRRALTEYLQRTGSRYVLAMVDADHFKKVNDSHGHDVGDQVLRMIASRLAVVGGGGRAFRFGGEEFTVVFAGARLTEALGHLERLRQGIAENPFQLRRADRPRQKPEKVPPRSGTRKLLKVTVSIGVAEHREAHADAEAVIREADQALYRAKKNGRNQVCPAPPGTGAP